MPNVVHKLAPHSAYTRRIQVGSRNHYNNQETRPFLKPYQSIPLPGRTPAVLAVFNLPKHPEINVPNLEVIKALQSLNSKGYVKTQFSWQYYYYSLTNEGIEYLRAYLHLPAEIVPRTFLKTAKTAGVRPGRGMD